MCGILGGNRDKWDYKAGLNLLVHRGPDGTRIEALECFTLGFTRLAIRDLSLRAMQPMFSGDGKVCIVFNGEIYGYDDLRKTLEKKYQFQTTSDTEVILNAYLEYGEKFIETIDGMFAIAIHDDRTKEVHIYRDRMGIKPLYYYYSNGQFAFASELKAVIATCTDVRFEKDNTALYDYLTYRYIPEPKSLYKNVYKLEPAHKLTFSLITNKLKKTKYWKLHVNTSFEKKRHPEELQYEIKRIIEKSVKEQLTADVPIGTFLSGGIDSSIVSAEIFKQSKQIQAFSMGFEVSPKEAEFDETAYAKILADSFGIPLKVFSFNKNELRKIKKDIVEWYDEPFADTSCYPTFMISKYAKEAGTTVVLTGDGGDEIFGGYTRYHEWTKRLEKKHLNLQSLSNLYLKILMPNSAKEEIADELMDDIALFSDECYCCPYKLKKKYAKKWRIGSGYDDYWYFRRFDHPELPSYTRAQYIDFKTYLPADILTKVDRAAMQNSLETRVPLLSKEIVEFSFSLSQADRCPEGELKGLLKNAYSGIIDDTILYKKKKGFSFPSSYWNITSNERFHILESIWKLS